MNKRLLTGFVWAPMIANNIMTVYVGLCVFVYLFGEVQIHLASLARLAERQRGGPHCALQEVLQRAETSVNC